jgi:hypothetical protein
MLIDAFRLIAIIVKFVIKDLWLGIYNILFGKQNEKIKRTYNKRISNRKRL